MNDITHTDAQKPMQLLEQLREIYLLELPDQCSELTAAALSLEKHPGNREIYYDFYRKVHNLKGSAGTHGISIISLICHNLEDYLSSLDSGAIRPDSRFTEVCLTYIDLLQSASEAAQNDLSDFSEIEVSLEHIRSDILADRKCGLIIESSSTMAAMYRNILSELPIQLSLLNNGLIGLEHLLSQKYDFLITGNEIGSLNGAALISALRVAESMNKDIPVIMVSTKSAKEIPYSGRPNHLIPRNMQLEENLIAAVKSVIRHMTP